jgi:hypothetical protein
MARSPASKTPKSKALAWWKTRADAERYVVDSAEIPTSATAAILRHDRLIHAVAGKRVVILKTPDVIDDRALFVANYWSVVSLVLRQYAPAAISGIDAVRLHVGDFAVPVELSARHAANRSKYDLPLDAEFVLALRPTLGTKTAVVSATITLPGPGGVDLPVLAPAPLLLTLDEDEIARDVDNVTIWIRHLVLRQPDLDRALEQAPRPVILQRIADIAGSVGNKALQRQLDRAARNISSARATPATTGIGTRVMIPAALTNLPVGRGSAWTDAQVARLTRQVATVDALLAATWKNPPSFSRRALVAHAKAAKAYDAYHSTTMEGYRISRAVSDAIVAGRPLLGGPQSAEDLRAAMAIKGYAYAFDMVLNLAAQKAPIDRNAILDLYEALFRPSVDAGIVEVHTLRGWRTWNVGLRGYRYVPPNPAKLHDLLIGLEEFAIRSNLQPVTRAMLMHLEFVTIHPFGDGNGRLGRLLMNLELLRAGLPWVTVRADERIPFFAAIERAQVEDDVNDFAQMMMQLIMKAARDLGVQQQARRKR